MSQVINTNVASLNSQRNLQMSQTTLATSLQRLSSGLRINSAKDDAAGLAISERFTTQIRGINQAVRNANDGISLAQVGESALAEVTSNLQRIRELAVQSSNATNSDSDRRALDLEVQQRLAEIDRIAGQTSFNGRKILDGSFGNAAFQIGANVGETIDVGLSTSMRQADIGATATATSVDLSTLITPASGPTDAVDAVPATMALGTFTAGAGGDATSDYTIAFTDGTDTLSVNATDGAGALTAADLAASFVTAGFVADGSGEVAGFTLDLGAQTTIEDAISNGTLTVTRADGSNFSATETVGGTAYTTTPAFANTATTTDGEAAIPASTGTAATPLTITDLTIQIGDADAVTITADDYDSQTELLNEINRQLGGNATASIDAETNVLSFTSGEDITIGGTDATTVFSAASFTAEGSLETVNVLTAEASNETMQRIDAALTSVSELRSTFGAIQNRFESTIANLQASSENLSASRSRILDADFAAETANLTRAQILQQAGVAMLAQANALPQNVLSLLR